MEIQLPASHTLEIRFLPITASPVGDVRQIDVPQMRDEGRQTGDALIGVAATITENYFLVGLSRGDATTRNLELLRSSAWIDVPLLLKSGKIAKITFEKGTIGEAVLSSAVASWQ